MDNQNEMQTWVYDYDRGGNILSKTRYIYTTGNLGQPQDVILYSYNDENWKDKLTSFNGTAIIYDNAGNPVNDGKWNYVWANGHKLVNMSSADVSLLFTYDHTGNRIRKVCNTDSLQEVTDYTMHDQRIVHMVTVHTDDNNTVSQENMHFFFASTSRPTMTSYNGNIFIYVYNLHGDVIGLRDTSSNWVVRYSYDVWGNLLNITGLLANTLGKRNPYRYRAYIYDEESQLYYLANRYYNPAWGRFLTPDISAETAPSVLLQERSVYSYCYNDPVSFADANGKMGFLAALGAMAVGGLVNAALGVVDSLVTGQAQDICYYVMTAGSFFESKIDHENVPSSLPLSGSSSGSSHDILYPTTELQKFYYIEASYYLNKSVNILCLMKNNVANIFEDPTTPGASKERKISYFRFQNVIMLMTDMYGKMRLLLEQQEELKCISLSNDNYIDRLNDFITECNRVLKVSLPTIE